MNDAELMVAVEGAPWMPWTHRRPNPKQNTGAVQHRLGREAEQAQHGIDPYRDAAAPVFDALQERLLALGDHDIVWFFHDSCCARCLLLGDWAYWQNSEQLYTRGLPDGWRWRTRKQQPPRR